MTDIEKLQKALELIESIQTDTYEMTKIQIELDIERLINWMDREAKNKADIEYNLKLQGHDL